MKESEFFIGKLRNTKSITKSAYIKDEGNLICEGEIIKDKLREYFDKLLNDNGDNMATEKLTTKQEILIKNEKQ